mmetsp:Transcript_5702/g.18273  ORF Transcript_5702/g.18273 Transcript_5702/m.18273 type:complete len:529 (-) Transcript_5702:1220-2806(-)
MHEGKKRDACKQPRHKLPSKGSATTTKGSATTTVPSLAVKQAEGCKQASQHASPRARTPGARTHARLERTSVSDVVVFHEEPSEVRRVHMFAAALGEVPGVAANPPDLARGLHEGVATQGGVLVAILVAALDALKGARLQVHARHDVVVRHHADDASLDGLDGNIEEIGGVCHTGRRPNDGRDVEVRGDDLGEHAPQRVAGHHEGVLRVILHQLSHFLPEALPDVPLRVEGRVQVNEVEHPLNERPGQDLQHGQEGPEELEQLHGGKHVCVQEGVQKRGCAFHRDDASPSSGVQLGAGRNGKVEVPPSGERLVLIHVHEPRVPLRLEAAVQHLLHVPEIIRRVIDDPCEVGQIQRPQGRAWRSPGHVADRVRPRLAGRDAPPSLKPGVAGGHVRHAHDGLHAFLVPDVNRRAAGQDHTQDYVGDEDDCEGSADELAEVGSQGVRARGNGHHQHAGQDEGVEPVHVVRTSEEGVATGVDDHQGPDHYHQTSVADAIDPAHHPASPRSADGLARLQALAGDRLRLRTRSA